MAGLALDGSFTTKTLEEIEAAFVVRQRADIDTALDASQFSVIGQLNGIMASELAALWEAALELHDALDPDKATGAAQDALYALTGTLRREPTYSSVMATVVLDAGANIAVDDAQASVIGNPVAKFRNVAAMVNTTGATAPFQVPFRAITTGPVQANATTLNVIDTPVSGWASIVNVLDADLGSDVESNSAFRRRRVEELGAQGGGTVPGLRGELLQLPTVRAAEVIENTRAVPWLGMPAKSIEAVVLSVAVAGDEATIATLLWENKAGGIETYGTESHDIVDAAGVTQTVKFSRPVARPIYVSVRLVTDPRTYAGDALAKDALVAAAEDPSAVGYLSLGAEVYAGRLVAAAMALPGVKNADARLSFSAMADFEDGTTSLVIEQREIATLDTSRITIGAFP